MGSVTVSNVGLTSEEILNILRGALRAAGHPVSLDRRSGGLFAMSIGSIRAMADTKEGISMNALDKLRAELKADAHLIDEALVEMKAPGIHSRRLSDYIRSSLSDNPLERFSDEMEAALKAVDEENPAAATNPLIPENLDS